MHFIFSSCDLYANIAKDSYMEYKKVDEAIQRLDLDFFESYSDEVITLFARQEKAAIIAVVFQALAIESYVNLFGFTVTGEIEIKKNGNFMPTAAKLELICSQLSAQYPSDGIKRIKDLFRKRDGLVHQKPFEVSIKKTPFDYSHPEKSYEDVSSAFETFTLLYNNLDNEMQLYDELKTNVTAIRNTGKELCEEMQEKQFNDSLQEIRESIREVFTFNL